MEKPNDRGGRRGASETRHAILHQLKTTGPLGAEALGRTLGVTAMAIRQHLSALETEGYVVYEDVVRGRGRPSRRWSLTDKAAIFFPDRHDELMASMLSAVKDTFGEDGMDKLLHARAIAQRRAYTALLADTPVLEAKVRALAAARTREGYMAEVRPDEDGDGWLLIENHCAICAAAKACQGFCRQELEVFQSVLGSEATVTRTEHLLSGGRRCVYAIRG